MWSKYFWILILLFLILIFIWAISEKEMATWRPYSELRFGGKPEKIFELELYKQALIDFINCETKIPKSALEGVFPKWIFLANMEKKINSDLIPTSNIIVDDDIRFLCQKYGKKYRHLEYHQFPFKGSLRKTKNLRVLKLSDIQRVRLNKIYTGTNFDDDAKFLINVYETLGGLNNLASIPLGLFDDDKPVELFGSPLNTQYSYCSAFEFEKEKWSSLGSFFDYEIIGGNRYIANPPFDSILMKKMAARLIEILDHTPKVAIIIVLPVWDPETQEARGLKNYGEKFEAYDLLKKSKYFRDDQFLDRETYRFYDYFKNKYEPLSHSHLILFENFESGWQLEKIMKRWRELIVART